MDTEDTSHDSSANAGRQYGGSIGRAVSAGQRGEQLTYSSVLEAIGGWRGVLETTVPVLLFIVVYSLTQDARAAAISAGVLALGALIIRLARRETIVAALSGVLGIGIAVLVTLITGRGIDYFLWGFVVNTAWGAALLISIVVGWPVVGLIIGALRGDWKGWRRDRHVRLVSTWLTLMWFALFVSRLVVQFPLYLSDQVEALGVARIVMGTPLFALGVVVTWIWIRRLPRSTPPPHESSDE